MAAVHMDVLNQIALILRNNGEQLPPLRHLLKQIVELPSYRHWVEVDEFLGHPFRLPEGFISSNTKERRLLEAFRLVVDDVLQVKVHSLRDGTVFLTDGLFVPADFRVFPWHDESDILVDACHANGWSGWPTIVIDPGTGCGHTLLRIEARERVGLDVSTRALCFAAVNTLLNERPATLLGLNDIRYGLPMLGGSLSERVLFVVNMPFALEPVPGTLVGTAAGGLNGYERTIDALRAINTFAASVRGRQLVRAIVLSYSVGSQKTDRWHVVDEATRLFGASSVSWTLLLDEKLWRINGKKEQPNPMPLSSLQMKADCQFYVRDPSMRDHLRQGYIEKQRELEMLGYDSLGYGILRIDSGE